MKRVLQGSLAHLSPPTLLRLLAATRGSGTLRLETPTTTVSLEVNEGSIASPPGPLRESLRAVLAGAEGSYRFEPGHARLESEERIDLGALVDEVRGGHRFSSDLTIEDLAGFVAGAPGGPDPIHVLPSGPPHNPLGELLAELEANAPEELLLAEVGVVSADPRPWRGSLEAAWRRRGWRVRLIAGPETVPTEELDLVVVHHRLSITRVGREQDWVDLLDRCRTARPPLSVVWVGPLGDPSWVHRLIELEVAFLMPPPQGEGGEVAHRFADALTLVMDRELRKRGGGGRGGELAGGVAELLDALLHGSDPGQAVGALLQLASTQVARGAVLLAEPEAIRCRAGFGYPLDHGLTAMPRGVGVLERVVRSGEPVLEVDVESAGVQQLARVLGLERLSPATAILPLGRGGATDGLLVVDRGGQPLPDLAELCLVARRLGGAVVAGLRSD